ncbi:hypothetical protein BD408DRAFT_414781 [Parasitella parasitica]|nr:hypothetical protein BD408DRAFT_414781 [Parasitella parasitica]
MLKLIFTRLVLSLYQGKIFHTIGLHHYKILIFRTSGPLPMPKLSHILVTLWCNPFNRDNSSSLLLFAICVLPQNFTLDVLSLCMVVLPLSTRSLPPSVGIFSVSYLFLKNSSTTSVQSSFLSSTPTLHLFSVGILWSLQNRTVVLVSSIFMRNRKLYTTVG